MFLSFSYQNGKYPNQISLFEGFNVLEPLEKSLLKRIQVYNELVKNAYGDYLETSIEHLRTKMKDAEKNLPLSQVSFAEPSDYDDGSFEYNLHHHRSRQTMNPTISPFAALSGLTHEKFISNLHGPMQSLDLAVPVDVSSKMIPIIDIEQRDQNNRKYQLNNYLMNFYRYGTEEIMLIENDFDLNDTYQAILTHQNAFSSITKSLSFILKNSPNEHSETFCKTLMRLFEPINKRLSVQFELAFTRG